MYKLVQVGTIFIKSIQIYLGHINVDLPTYLGILYSLHAGSERVLLSSPALHTSVPELVAVSV